MSAEKVCESKTSEEFNAKIEYSNVENRLNTSSKEASRISLNYIVFCPVIRVDWNKGD